MIAIRPIDEVTLDYKDVVRHSPVADMAGAAEHLMAFAKASSAVYVGYIDGDVACIYGLMPPSLLSDRVYLWLLTTDTATEHKFVFIRHSQIVIERILAKWDTIIGDALVEDLRAIKWLGWLGAHFAPPRGAFRPFQINKQSFERRRYG